MRGDGEVERRQKWDKGGLLTGPREAGVKREL